MCENCGCSITEAVGPRAHPLRVEVRSHEVHAQEQTASIVVLRNLLAENDRIASHNREHFDLHRVLAVNLMSSPGAGKTALLERTIDALAGAVKMAVIEGDLATENDARRIRAKGIPAVQITTGSACHLDAHMLHDALHGLELDGLDILFIENVGNLVCPASFDLGQHLDVVLLSVPEGDDKPQKYPVMFRAADLVLLSKIDLLAALPEFDVERAAASLRAVGSGVPVMPVSCRGKQGIEAWCGWLLQQRALHRQRSGAPARDHGNERAAAPSGAAG